MKKHQEGIEWRNGIAEEEGKGKYGIAEDGREGRNTQYCWRERERKKWDTWKGKGGKKWDSQRGKGGKKWDSQRGKGVKKWFCWKKEKFVEKMSWLSMEKMFEDKVHGGFWYSKQLFYKVLATTALKSKETETPYLN